MTWQIHVFFLLLTCFLSGLFAYSNMGSFVVFFISYVFLVVVFFKDKLYVSYRAVSYRAVSLIWITRQSCNNMRMLHQTDGASLPYSTKTTTSADAYRKRFHFPLCRFYYCYYSDLKCIFNEYILWINVMKYRLSQSRVFQPVMNGFVPLVCAPNPKKKPCTFTLQLHDLFTTSSSNCQCQSGSLIDRKSVV